MKENSKRSPAPRVHLVVPPHLRVEMESFLASQSSDDREALMVVLCKKHRVRGVLRLLVRHVVYPGEGCFKQRSAGRVECNKEFDDFVLEQAENEGLTAVTLHTHLHFGTPNFSPVDDSNEAKRAQAIFALLQRRVSTASVVYDMQGRGWSARYWHHNGKDVQAFPMKIVSTIGESLETGQATHDPRFDRQVRAFGSEGQRLFRVLWVALIGLGGLGILILEGLVRLGIRRFVLVDRDVVEWSNLNRLSGATQADALDRLPKVELGRRTIRQMHGLDAKVVCLQTSLPDPLAIEQVSGCDLIITATDNQVSRFDGQRIASAYLRPLVNAGVGLSAKDGAVTSISARVTNPPLGGPWCLACGGHVNLTEVAKERTDGAYREMLEARGYLDGTPRPAVHWVNSFAASQTVQVVHNLVAPFHPDGLAPKDIFMDLVEHSMFNIEQTPEEDGCLVCGSRGDGLRGIGHGLLKPRQIQIEDLDLKIHSENVERLDDSIDPSYGEADSSLSSPEQDDLFDESDTALMGTCDSCE